MRTYKDRLQLWPTEMLRDKIERQEAEMELIRRDIEIMKSVIDERIDERVEDKRWSKQGDA